LSLGRLCQQVHIAAHELGHTLGFIHAMARHDRDRYMTVLLENVKAKLRVNRHNLLISLQPHLRDNFAIKSPESNDNYGLPLDMGSIMHYGVTRLYI
uniref:Metalloendopeptidase n=1 Tax=Heligmosomoides polygyrus TaxID=6339 RepID=A0A183G813_HELPZ